MWTNPNRSSLTSVGEKRCVSVTLKNRARTGVSKGKLRDAVLMLLDSVLPSDSCKSPPPNGKKLSESEKKNRAETLSAPPRNSRSQFEVNWSSVNLPGRLMANAPVVGLPLGIRKPLEVPPNWLLLNWRSLTAIGSRLVTPTGRPVGKKVAIKEASVRFWASGSVGIVVLINVPAERPLR